MRKGMVSALIVLSAVILIAAVLVISNPLRRSQEQIRNRILELTPMGSDMEDVLKVIESKTEWEIDSISYEHGYLRPGTPDPSDVALGRETIIGEQSIRVFIGEYRTLFTTSVTVFFGFDAASKLIDVHVWKDTDTW